MEAEVGRWLSVSLQFPSSCFSLWPQPLTSTYRPYSTLAIPIRTPEISSLPASATPSCPPTGRPISPDLPADSVTVASQSISSVTSLSPHSIPALLLSHCSAPSIILYCPFTQRVQAYLDLSLSPYQLQFFNIIYLPSNNLILSIKIVITRQILQQITKHSLEEKAADY